MMPVRMEISTSLMLSPSLPSLSLSSFVGGFHYRPRGLSPILLPKVMDKVDIHGRFV